MHEFFLAKYEWCPLDRSYSILNANSVQMLNKAFGSMRHPQYFDVFSKLLGHASDAE